MDVCQEGLGAVLLQEEDRVIAYASCVLTKAEMLGAEIINAPLAL